MNISELKTKLERLKGQKILLKKTEETLQADLLNLKRKLGQHEQAKAIVNEVGLKTQQQLTFHISNLVTMANDYVFPDPYKLKVDFVQRRNKTECDLLFERDGNVSEPTEEAGIGAVDVSSLALRCACWSMNTPHTRNVILLDEPFKHLKGLEPNRKALEIIREISKKLKIQIIMISDERIPREDIIETADKVFETYKKKGVTKIHVIE